MATSTAPHHPDPVPLAVWPVAQRSAQWQRAGRYHPDSAKHPGKMLPDLARRIVAEYSQPGALVCDPFAGVGTTVVEAAALERRAVGIELEPRWVSVAAANVEAVLPRRQRSLVELRQGDATKLGEVAGDLAGRVDLVCTSPPYACDVGFIDMPAWRAGGSVLAKSTLNYSTDRANLGHARGSAYVAIMAGLYAACATLLRPRGILAVTTKTMRRRGHALDLAAMTVALAEAAGFNYLQHVVALHAAVRDGGLAGRPSYWQTMQLRRARERTEPVHLVVHEDVSVLVAPDTAHSSEVARAR